MHAQTIATDGGTSDRRKDGLELVADRGRDVTKVKSEGSPNLGATFMPRGASLQEKVARLVLKMATDFLVHNISP
jgi:hypothetical protein